MMADSARHLHLLVEYTADIGVRDTRNKRENRSNGGICEGRCSESHHGLLESRYHGRQPGDHLWVAVKAVVRGPRVQDTLARISC